MCVRNWQLWCPCRLVRQRFQQYKLLGRLAMLNVKRCFLTLLQRVVCPPVLQSPISSDPSLFATCTPRLRVGSAFTYDVGKQHQSCRMTSWPFRHSSGKVQSGVSKSRKPPPGPSPVPPPSPTPPAPKPPKYPNYCKTHKCKNVVCKCNRCSLFPFSLGSGDVVTLFDAQSGEKTCQCRGVTFSSPRTA